MADTLGIIMSRNLEKTFRLPRFFLTFGHKSTFQRFSKEFDRVNQIVLLSFSIFYLPKLSQMVKNFVFLRKFYSFSIFQKTLTSEIFISYKYYPKFKIITHEQIAQSNHLLNFSKVSPNNLLKNLHKL